MTVDWNTVLIGVLAVVPLLLLITSGFLALECGLALWGRGQMPKNAPPLPEDITLAVIVPAHNEASGIARTLGSIQAQLRSRDRLLVIADNCTDHTATLAQQAGAWVVERHNPTQRGKGYALDYGLKQLAPNPPDIVVFVDADCDLHPGCLSALAQQALATGRPVQATYLMETPQPSTVKDKISAFAFKVKNLVRPMGLFYMGQPCLLTGTGIALPWAAATAVSVASGHIVEDMKLGLDLALAGYPPQFCPSAWVTSRLPSQAQAAATQRTRWEHGHLTIMKDYGLRLLGRGLGKGRPSLVALGLELLILPISFQGAVTLGVMALAVLVGLLGLGWLPAYLGAMAVISLGSAIALAWLGYGRPDLSLGDLAQVPGYILGKVPLYRKFIVKPETNWIRTERDR
jgi:cellulose synthase/poly-beta-1,6-N-acetylglucosamine synthase-like glycosyltransferase